MKKHISIILLLISLNSYTQNDIISIGKRDFIYSNILKEQRELWIYIPEGLDDNKNNQDVYPVVYLLDGEYNFKATAGIIEFLSKNDFCPDMILVGIINKNRGRDFSPSPSLLWPDSGGADNFLNFLEKELIPHIDTNYPTASYKMLIGHSLGGTFTVYSMIHSPELFNSYILIDPNICWDNNFLFNQWEKLSKKIDLSNEQVYLSYTYWDKTLDSMKIKNDTTENTECMKTKFEFYDVLDSLETINIKSRFYTNETHSSLSLISIYDGLNYIFNYFKPPVIHNNIDSVKNAKDLIQDHYDMVSNRIGFKVWPSDDLIDGVLYLYLINNMSDQKNEILKLKKIK